MLEAKPSVHYTVSMKNSTGTVYGIGNPLIDVLVNVSYEDLEYLGLHKGTMNLISVEQRLKLSEFISKLKTPTYSCGGSCPNTMITLAALGVGVTLAGKVGNDEYGSIYKERLKSLGVCDNLAVCDAVTGSSIILISPDSDRTMNTYLGANRMFTADDVVPESVINSDFFHFTGYMWDTQNQKDSVYKALEIAHKHDVTVSFDIADMFAVTRYHDMFLKLIKEHCDVVFANKDEAENLFGNPDPRQCCMELGKMCRTAVVKNGKRGSFVCDNGVMYDIPVIGPSIPVDTTGAGDTYAAGFLYGLCHKKPILECGEVASYLAGEIIQQVGAQFTCKRGEGSLARF